MQKPPRIWISNPSPQAGESVRVRSQIEPPLELPPAQDKRASARGSVSRFEVWLGPDLLLRWKPEAAIASNPYLEFTFKARKSEKLQMVWIDSQGQRITAHRNLQISSNNSNG